MNRIVPLLLSFCYIVQFSKYMFPTIWLVVGSNGLEPSTSRLSGARSNHLSYEPISVAGLSILRLSQTSLSLHGGDEGIRTPDPLRARQVLSQLSYTPMFFRASRAVPSSLRVCSLSVAPSKLNNVFLFAS